MWFLSRQITTIASVWAGVLREQPSLQESSTEKPHVIRNTSALVQLRWLSPKAKEEGKNSGHED